MTMPMPPKNIGTATEIKGVIQTNDHEMLPEISSPKYAFYVANELRRFVTEQKLVEDIQGRPYALVEAWQFCGSHFGLYPVVVDLKNESTYEDVTYTWTDSRKNEKKVNTKHYKYRATVEIRRHKDDKIVGRAEIVCSNEERTKHDFAEYAIMSMAQTRATGKAFRLLMGWVMKAAGFEATPYEEMTELEEFMANVPTPEHKKALVRLAMSARYDFDEKQNNDKRVEALATIAGCMDYDLFGRIEARLKSLQPSIDEVVNPSQKDIKEHLKKSL